MSKFVVDNLLIFIYIYKCSKNDPLAQLGERYLDRVEVTGSNPVRVTIHILINNAVSRFRSRGRVYFIFEVVQKVTK